MSGTNQPTLAGFVSFIANVMDTNPPTGPANPLILPPTSPVIPISYQIALSIVNPALAAVPNVTQGITPAAPSIYALAVYNLAGSNLINFAQDQSGRTYFRDLRKDLGINAFVPGVVAGSSDQGTATSNLNPEFMRNLTLANLQQLRDPYGRAYLAFAQAAGPTIWGLS